MCHNDTTTGGDMNLEERLVKEIASMLKKKKKRK